MLYFYVTVSSGIFCAKLFGANSFNTTCKCSIYLQSKSGFPLVNFASVLHDYQSYIYYYTDVPIIDFTSGVIKQTLRSQTNNIFPG